MTARTYYDVDSTEGRPTFSPAGIRPSKASQRVAPVIAHAFKVAGLPFDDRSHLPVRRYIARMRLTSPQLVCWPGTCVNTATMQADGPSRPTMTIASGTGAATGNIGASCSMSTAPPCRCWLRRGPGHVSTSTTCWKSCWLGREPCRPSCKPALLASLGLAS